MPKLTFKGGCHPPEKKELTNKKPIETFPPVELYIVPVLQALGAPSQPIVTAGQDVKTGQVIANPSGYVSVPVHSPVTGKVTRIEEFPHPLGKEVLSIFIERTKDDEWELIEGDNKSFNALTCEEINKRVLQGGLVGLGGATFPTHVKISPPKDKKIDTLILNGAECEPYLTADHRLMLEYPDKIIEGMKILAKALNANKMFIGIEKNKLDAI